MASFDGLVRRLADTVVGFGELSYDILAGTKVNTETAVMAFVWASGIAGALGQYAASQNIASLDGDVAISRMYPAIAMSFLATVVAGAFLVPSAS